ncbi:TatD family deoxyribonuclease [Patescibacteria group bacterium]|nr:MAG: TatD family deoxyribonuclease [Patescibacteria group bacterium]
MAASARSPARAPKRGKRNFVIDTHCHVQFKAFAKDSDEVIKRCAEKGVVLNVVGTQKDTSAMAVKFAEKYDNIFATVGLHPIHTCSTEVDEEEITFKSREEEFDYEYYKKLASHPKVIAIGECGLELFHLPKKIDKDDCLKTQKKNFIAQIDLARELDLPLVIHVRDAYEETLSVIANEVKQSHPLKGVIHCYSSDWPTAQKFLNLGFYIGFTSIITFPPRKTNPKPDFDLVEVVKNCPLDKILIETDAPYLAPQAYRGKRCEPWMVEEVAKKIAEIKGLSFKEVVEISENNAKKLFNKLKS